MPGAVGGWAALAERYGRLGLDALPRRRDRRRRERLRRHAAHCRRLGARRPRAGGVPAGAERGGDRPPARARRDAAAHRDEGPIRVLRGRRGAGDRVRHVARGGGSRRLRGSLGRAALDPVPRPHRARAPAADAGSCGARGARPARALLAEPGFPDPLHAARARGRVRPRARRRGREGPPRALRSSTAAGQSTRWPSPSRPAAPCTSAPSTPTGWPSRSSSRTTWASGRASARRARASRSRTAARASRCRAPSSRAAGRTTRSSRGCCSATASWRGRSA